MPIGSLRKAIREGPYTRSSWDNLWIGMKQPSFRKTNRFSRTILTVSSRRFPLQELALSPIRRRRNPSLEAKERDHSFHCTEISFYFEDKGLIRPDQGCFRHSLSAFPAGSAPAAISKIRGNVEYPLRSLLHELQPLGQALDELVNTKHPRLTALLVGVVEFGAVDKCAPIVDPSLYRSLPVAFRCLP